MILAARFSLLVRGSRLASFGLTAASGAALVLGFAPWSWSALAPLPMAILFFQVRSASTKHALARGYVFGLGLFGGGIAWIHVAVLQFGAGLLVAVPATAALVMLLSVFPAAALALAAWASRPISAIRFTLLPAAWVLCEWLRGWLFTGFPWLQLGYTQTGSQFAPLLAPMTGVLGLSAIVAFFAAGLAFGIQRGKRRGLVPLTLLWAIVLLLPWPTLSRLSTEPVGDAIEVALVQGNVPQAVKWHPQDRQGIIARYRQLSAPYWDSADLIVWPETAIPVIYRDGSTKPFKALAQRARGSRARLITGALRLHGDRVYNSVFDLGSGEFSDKEHLVPFGEYVPFNRWLQPLLDWLGIDLSNLAAASRMSALSIGNIVAGAPICYEMAFGAQVARFAANTQLLVNISDDAWFGRTIGLWQNLEMARMRAMETGRPVLRATNTGLTAVIDVDGQVRKRIAPFSPGVLVTDVVPRTGETPYVRWRDAWIAWLAITSAGTLALVISRAIFASVL